jgi:hypothetical protein
MGLEKKHTEGFWSLKIFTEIFGILFRLKGLRAKARDPLGGIQH